MSAALLAAAIALPTVATAKQESETQRAPDLSSSIVEAARPPFRVQDPLRILGIIEPGPTGLGVIIYGDDTTARPFGGASEAARRGPR